MNLENVLRESLNYLKSIQSLPDKGFIAGGSLANTAWSLSRGTDPVVNDIDVFLLNPKIIKDKFDYEHTNIGPYFKSMHISKEDYFRFYYHVDNFLIIENSSNIGLLNLVNYSCSTSDPQIVIESFDLNCCQVGYHIESDKFLWTPAFEKFFIDGKIQISNLSTPCHTAIRYVKKCTELGVEIDEFELDLVEFCIHNKFFGDITRWRFKSKYKDLFLKYEYLLGKRFEMVDNPELEEWLKRGLGIVEKIYTLKIKSVERYKEPSHVFGLGITKVFLDWIRQNGINQSNFHKRLWELDFLKSEDLTLDEYISDYFGELMFIEFMHKLGRHSSEASTYLYGLTLPQQVSVIETILTPFVSNSIFALAIIQGNTFGDRVPKVKDILLEDLPFDERLLKIKKISLEVLELTKSEKFMELWRQKYMFRGTNSIEWINQSVFNEVFLRKFKIKKLLRTRDNPHVKNTNPHD